MRLVVDSRNWICQSVKKLVRTAKNSVGEETKRFSSIFYFFSNRAKIRPIHHLFFHSRFRREHENFVNGIAIIVGVVITAVFVIWLSLLHDITVIHCRRVAGFRRIPMTRKLRACPKGGRERAGSLVANISRLVDFRSQTSLETCKIHTTINRERFVERVNAFLIVIWFNHDQFAVCVRTRQIPVIPIIARMYARVYACLSYYPVGVNCWYFV